MANTGWYIFNFRRNLIAQMSSLGYRIAAICPEDDFVGRLQDLGVMWLPWNLEQTGTAVLGELMAIYHLRAMFKRIRPVAVVSFTPKGNIYSGLALFGLNGSSIPNISGLGRGFSSVGVAGYVFRSLYRHALRRADIVFFQNEEDRREFVKRGIVRADITERLMGSGVDLDRFNLRPLPCELTRGSRNATFLMMARLLREKGVPEYVEAARNLRRSYPGIRFLLLGPFDKARGISKYEVEKWRKEGIIEYLGVREEVTEVIASADCVVLPSYYREGVPRSLMEAAAMGRVCITTDMPGCRDVVVDGETGWICRPRDVADLSARMEEFILRDVEQRLMMGKRARGRMEALFDERVIIQRYVSVLEKRSLN